MENNENKNPDAKNPDVKTPGKKTPGKKRIKLRRLLLKIPKKVFYPLVSAIAVALCIAIMFAVSSANTFSTDNAKVTAKMYTVNAISSGKLLEWNVATGDMVSQGEMLGRQEVLPGIFSPADGTVVKSDYSIGQSVTPQTTLAVIADTDNMYIGVNIEETDIMKIAVGQKVDVKIDAYGNRKFSGTVSEIDSATQTYFSSGLSSFSTSGAYTKVTQLIPVKVTIENPDKLPMVFGMNCDVKIHLN